MARLRCKRGVFAGSGVTGFVSLLFDIALAAVGFGAFVKTSPACDFLGAGDSSGAHGSLRPMVTTVWLRCYTMEGEEYIDGCFVRGG